MTLRFSPPPCPDSPLRRLDARWRLAGLLLCLAAAALVRSAPAAGLAVCGALLLAWLGRLPWRWYLSRLLALAGPLLLFALPLPILVRGGPAEGARLALVIVLKGLALITLALVLLATGPVDVTLKAAHALRVPGLLVQLVLLTYRYLFVLADEFLRLRVALRARGFRNRMSWHSYRTVGQVAGALVVRGSERAERVAQAMRCRGFDGRFRSLVELRTRRADVVAFVLLAMGAATTATLDLWLTR
jgi:cobalt/nickel transport system permease protein